MPRSPPRAWTGMIGTSADAAVLPAALTMNRWRGFVATAIARCYSTDLAKVERAAVPESIAHVAHLPLLLQIGNRAAESIRGSAFSRPVLVQPVPEPFRGAEMAHRDLIIPSRRR